MMNEEQIERFKGREVKAKDIFKIVEIDKAVAYRFVRTHHYLGDKKFFATYCYGLLLGETLVGVATYSALQGSHSLMGWFGIDDNGCDYVLELSRLAMLPTLNGTNATSYLLGNSMRMLHRDHGIKAVTTLATSDRHVGSIYQVCNFKYYGLTDVKSEFFNEVLREGEPHDRGIKSNCRGVWVQRARKHRYAYVMDKHLKVLYEEQPYPKKDDKLVRDCCGDSGIVLDKRYGIWYKCPICNGYDGRLTIVKYADDNRTKDVDRRLRDLGFFFEDSIVNDIVRLGGSEDVLNAECADEGGCLVFGKVRLCVEQTLFDRKLTKVEIL